MNQALSEGLYVNSVQMFLVALKSLGTLLQSPFCFCKSAQVFPHQEDHPWPYCPEAFLPVTLSQLPVLSEHWWHFMWIYSISLVYIFPVSVDRGCVWLYHSCVPCVCQPVHSLAVGRHPINNYWTSTFFCTESSSRLKETKKYLQKTKNKQTKT